MVYTTSTVVTWQNCKHFSSGNFFKIKNASLAINKIVKCNTFVDVSNGLKSTCSYTLFK